MFGGNSTDKLRDEHQGTVANDNLRAKKPKNNQLTILGEASE